MDNGSSLESVADGEGEYSGEGEPPGLGRRGENRVLASKFEGTEEVFASYIDAEECGIECCSVVVQQRLVPLPCACGVAYTKCGIELGMLDLMVGETDSRDKAPDV